jgi:hypothetical protein
VARALTPPSEAKRPAPAANFFGRFADVVRFDRMAPAEKGASFEVRAGGTKLGRARGLMSTTNENLRREARLEAAVPVAVLRRGGLRVELWTSDISFRGLFVRTPKPPPLRSLVRMRVALPAGTIETHAMVVHVVEGEAGGAGLQFWGLSGADRATWDDFVRARIAERRKTLKRPPAASADAAHPAMTDPPTPSGVRVVGPFSAASNADGGGSEK